ncbi:MAG: phage portal protein [Giesbergeria sp.]
MAGKQDKDKNDKRATPTWLDRTIGWIAPRTGLRRAGARQMLSRAYEGASRSDGWRVRRAGASARADYIADAREVRYRARALVSNVPLIAQAVSVMVSCTIGIGIGPRWVNDRDGRIASRWKAWGKLADYDGLLDFNGLQGKAWATMKVDGEVLARMRERRVGPTVVPLQIQLLEIDWLDVERNEMRGDSEVIAGIEYGRRGERAAYWLFDRHPGDMGLRATLRESQRVPADEIIHLFNPARPGQQAGISALAPVIPTVRDLQVYEDAEQARKNLETRMSVLGEWDESLLTDADLPKNQTGESGPVTLDLGELAGGGLFGMPPGMKNPTFIQPNAAPGYVEYVKHKQKIICAGMGVPYEFATGDMSEVNFSSSRVRTNQYKRDVEREQWTLAVPMFCERIATRWLSLLDLAGMPAPPDVYPDWTTPKWASVNPVQDVAADLSEIKGGLSSISEKIRQRGYDPELVFSELKSDLERLNKDGTLPLLAALLGAQNPLDLLGSLGDSQDSSKK